MSSKEGCMGKILLIEDDPEIRELLSSYLKDNGYETDTAEDGIKGKQKAAQDDYALILLDIMLPYMSGDQFLTELRKQSDVPVIVISAKDMVQTRIDVIRMGADDYITKPFDLGEVLVRIEALLRRSGGKAAARGILSHKNLRLDTDRCRVYVKERELSLTAKEFEILKLLLANPDKLFSRSNIFESVWDEESGNYDDNAVKVHMSNLRGKLADLDTEEYIETVWGMGYRLAK